MPDPIFPKQLLEGYKKFLASGFKEQSHSYKKLALEGQKPEVLIISCCDSRAVPESIFNTDPGQIFVIRNIANQVPPFEPDGNYHSTSAALEYAVEGLQVRHILVLGHSNCGGVANMLANKPLSETDFIGKWMRLLQPAADEINNVTYLTAVERQHALERIAIRYSIKNLRTFPWIVEKESSKQLHIHGAWFNISNGELWVMDPVSGDFRLAL